MAEEYGTLTTEITAPNRVGAKSFIYDLSDQCNLKLEIVYEDQGFLQHTMRIKTTGYESQLNVFQDKLEDAMHKWKEVTFSSESYNVNEIVMKTLPDNTLKVEIDAHRFSGIKDFATQMYNHFEIPMGAEEKTNLFNKNLTLQVMGTQKQIEQFKSIFLAHVHSKKPIKILDVDMDGNPVATTNKNFRF